MRIALSVFGISLMMMFDLFGTEVGDSRSKSSNNFKACGNLTTSTEVIQGYTLVFPVLKRAVGYNVCSELCSMYPNCTHFAFTNKVGPSEFAVCMHVCMCV